MESEFGCFVPPLDAFLVRTIRSSIPKPSSLLGAVSLSGFPKVKVPRPLKKDYSFYKF
jgi:hypothetical protein